MKGKINTFIRMFLVFCAAGIIGIGLKVSIGDMDHEKRFMENLQFMDEINGYEISYVPWKARKEKTYYLILPSAYQSSNFEAVISYEDKFYSFYIDDRKYANGDLWKDSLKEELHSLKVFDFFGRVCMETPFQVLVSDLVPAVMVTVEAKEALYSKEEYANKEYLEKGEILILEEDGDMVLSETMERFRVRGNLTSNMEKKPFTFTLGQKKALCGMEEATNWHLLANATDGSHIRNKIMLDWAGEISEEYHPEGVFTDLFINGEYQGLYLLTETVEIAENRLEADEENSILAEMELDYRAKLEQNTVVTKEEHYWVVHKELPMEQKSLEEVTEYLNDIESALYSKEGVSQISGKKLEELLDFDSWTDAWLLKELSSDHDLGTTSQFGVVKDWKNKSIFLAGPEWDFDGTLGNGMVPWSRNPRNLVTAIPNTKGIESVSQNKWLSQMYQHEKFRAMLIEKFKTEIQPKVKQLLETQIDAYAQEIRRAALLDSLRWLGNGVVRYFAEPEGFSLGKEKDYHKYDVLDVHLDMIKDFLKEKNQFLQELWVEGIEFEVEIEEHNEEGMSLELNNDIYTWIPKKKKAKEP